MDHQSMSALTEWLRDLSVVQPTQTVTKPTDLPTSTSAIDLVDDAYCQNCDGYGHWLPTCDFLEHTRLSGRPLSFLSGLPDAELRFHLCLPWLALKYAGNLRDNNADLQIPSTLNDAICLLLSFTSHLADYAIFRWAQYRMLNNTWLWLHKNLVVQRYANTSCEVADQVNDSRNVSQILAAWNALADESLRSLGELIGNIARSLKEFEKSAVIMPIASEMRRYSRPPIPGLSMHEPLRYSEIWNNIMTGETNQILGTHLDQQHFRHLLVAISNHRAAYMRRQAVVDQIFHSAVVRHHDVREDPRLLVVFSVPKILAVQMEIAAVDALREEDFIWPDRQCLLTRWFRAVSSADLVDASQAETEITRMFDITGI